MRFLTFCLTLAAAMVGSLSHAFTPTQDGLYAVFDTTMGEFTVKLKFEETTQTVANFVGLAEGSLPWIDQENGVIRYETPFYDGIIFHRVIANFMIQAGSPNGTGTDGPGYNIFDEIIFNDEYYQFDRPGLIAMANTGRANSGGSQFFVTVNTPTHLNNKHTIFGEVVDGMTVVQAINAVPTTNDKPNTDVVINSVTILRQGAAAQAFDPASAIMPSLGDSDLGISIDNDDYQLTFDIQPDYSYSVFQSLDLQSWEHIGNLSRTFTLASQGLTAFTVGNNNDVPINFKSFWHGVRTTYPPLANGGKTIEVKDGNDALQFTIVLNGDLSGTFTPAGAATFPFEYYDWHTFGSNGVTLYIRGEALRPLQFYFIGGQTGEALFFLEATQNQAEDFINNLFYEISDTVVVP